MKEKREKYVIKQDGRYHWRTTPKMKGAGFRNEPLCNDLDKANDRARELNKQWDSVLAEAAAPEFDPGSGTFEWLTRRYQRDPVWYGKKAFVTKDEVDRSFDRINKELGPTRVSAFTAQYGRALYNKFRDQYTVSGSEKAWKWFVSLMKFAAESGVIPYNPVAGMKIEHPPARDKVYTPDEVSAIIEGALYGGKAKSGNLIPARRSIALATAIAYDTTMPQADVLRLTWSQWDGVGFTGKQQKERSGDNLYWPVSERTRDLIKSTLQINEYVIISETTRLPYLDPENTAARSQRMIFSKLFRYFRRRAGVEGRTFHDLRRTKMTELGNAGATETEIGALSGHKPGSRVLKNYVIPGKDAAIAAFNKFEAKTARDLAKKGKK